jgi:hypothetical protein
MHSTILRHVTCDAECAWFSKPGIIEQPCVVFKCGLSSLILTVYHLLAYRLKNSRTRMAAVHYFEQLNAWSRILVKKLAFFEVLNSTHFAGPEGSLPHSHEPSRLSLSRARSILILFSHRRQGFPSVFPIRTR